MHRLNKAFILQRNFTIMNPASPKLIGEIMIQVSSFICHILIMMQSQRNSSQRILGRTTTITSSTPLLKCLNDSLDNGQTEDNFFNFKSIKESRGSYSLPDPEHVESSYNLLTEWDPGEKTWKSTTITIPDFNLCGNF